MNQTDVTGGRIVLNSVKVFKLDPVLTVHVSIRSWGGDLGTI